MLGFDSMYMLTQSAVIFILGSGSFLIVNQYANFITSLVVMVTLSTLLYGVLFKKMGNQLISMLMIGIILSTLFRSLSSFFQMVIDPNEFSIIQDKSFASFNNMNTNILWVVLFITLIILVYISDEFKKIDIIALGKDHAINLGINYDKNMRKYLIIISFLIAVATALVGPIMFLGLLVVNMARAISKTYKHTSLIFISFLLALIFLVGGQFLLERVFNFSVPLSIVINFIGGIYMLFLLRKEMVV
jgi:iron complex transport system permease protein